MSWRVHGQYARRLADAPVGGDLALAELVVRRFKCLNPQCPAVTFVEQIEGLTSPAGCTARGRVEHPRRQGQAP
ncbi:hypothetical protein ACWG5P_23670 [Streptomyces prasinus]